MSEELVGPSLHLVRNHGFKWYRHISEQWAVWAKGYIFDVGNTLHEKENLCEYFATADTESEFVRLLLAANGSFAVVLYNRDFMLAAVDRLRSMPLFYTTGDGARLIGDDADILASVIGDVAPEETSLEEFALTGFVVGRNTLHPQIKEIQAGEYVRFERGNFIPAGYFRHLHSHDRCVTEEEHFTALADISRRVAERLISSTHDRPIVLPLSGGYDSRYIACMLKELNYKNVICYTYGRSDSDEVITSRQVADALNYDWYFVEHTAAKVRDVFSGPQLEAFYNYCHNRSSAPHNQEFIALTELRSMGILPNDAIIVPGFCGDLLGGSYVPREFQLGYTNGVLKRGLVNYIADKHFYARLFANDVVTNAVRKHIQQVLDEIRAIPDTAETFTSYNEAFFTMHKVAKFVVNSLRIYEFFGMEWRMPLWDQELAGYWYSVPLNKRIGSSLYNRFLFENYFRPMNVAVYKKQVEGRAVKIQRLFRYLGIPYPFASNIVLKASKLSNQFGGTRPHFNAHDEYEKFYTSQLYSANMPLTHMHQINGIIARWWLWKKYGWMPALYPIRPVSES